MEAGGIRTNNKQQKGSLERTKNGFQIMADIKWIKISCDLFDDEAIKVIEQMPEGDAIIVIWLKLLIATGKINDNGYLYFKKAIPYTDELLATVFNRSLNTVRLAIKTFEQFGMIQIMDEQGIYITNWEKYQNIEGMEKIKAQTKERVKRFRERKKEEQKLLTCNDTCNDTCNVTVTDSNATDKEEDKEEEKKKKNFVAKSFFQKLFTFDEEIKKYSSLKDLFIEFLEYKTAIKKQYKTEKSVRNAFLDFVRLSQNDENYARALVDNAIARGWQSIYDLSAEQKKAFKNAQNESQSDVADDWESRCM